MRDIEPEDKYHKRIEFCENQMIEIAELEKKDCNSFCLMCNEGYPFITKTSKKRCKECKRRSVVSISNAKQRYLKGIYESQKKIYRTPQEYRIININEKYILLGEIKHLWED